MNRASFLTGMTTETNGRISWLMAKDPPEDSNPSETLENRDSSRKSVNHKYDIEWQEVAI